MLLLIFSSSCHLNLNMKKFLILILLVTSTACHPPTTEDPTDTPTDPTEESASALKVGSFNVQVFGVSKMSDPAVVHTLVKIFSRYDLILMQEIRDANGTSIIQFMQDLNDANSNQYSYIISSRLGRSSSKEQYAFIYKKSLVKVLDQYVFNDGSDVFEREPLIALWEFIPTGEQFFTIGLHAKPEDVVNELNALDNVYYEAEDLYNNNKSIIMGDFNADCTYLNDTQYNNLLLRNDSQFSWSIPKTWDTTSGSTDCAYDNLLTTGSFSNRVSGVHVFNYQNAYSLDNSQTSDVSDHYPIGLTISF